MFESIAGLAPASGFMPHGMCYLWTPSLLWSMVTADALIVAAYYSIPLSLIALVRVRPELSYNRLLLMFGVFIFACGTTHLMNIITVWEPWYWLEAGIKFVTAIVSAATAIALWPAVARVSNYVDERERAEQFLREVNNDLQTSLTMLEAQRSNLERLNRMSGLLQVCTSTEEVARVIADTAVKITNAPAGVVYLISEDGSMLDSAASWGEVPKQDLVFRASECWAIRQGSRFPDEAASTLTCDVPDGEGSAHVCYPLSGGSENLGVLQLRRTTVSDNSQSESLMSVLVDRAGLALANVRMRENLTQQSTRDSLTNLFNRAYLDESLLIEERRARRSYGQFCIAMFDLDRFKVLNDSLGHHAGDLALARFAELLREHVRGSDIPCRYGGEEFAVVLPDTALKEGLRIAERVRQATENQGDQFGGPPITVSVGVAVFPDHGNTARSVLDQADQALYAAKNAGRNRVIAANDA